MPNIQSTPRNEILGYLSDALKSGKSAANQYQILPQVPLIGGTGLGDLFMGRSPELLDDMSYDGLQAAIRGGNAATGGIGTYGARPAVADAALLSMDLAGLGKGIGGLARKSASTIYDSLINGTTSLSRREALKKIGAVAGSAATAGSAVGLLRNFAKDTAPKIADNVTSTVASPKTYRFNTLSDYLENVKGHAEDEAFIEYMENGGHSLGLDVPESYIRKWMNHFLKNDEVNYTNAKDLNSGFLRLDPGSPPPPPMEINYNPITKQFENIEYLDAFSPQAKQEMKDFKNGVNKLNSDYAFDGTSDNHWINWVNNSDNYNETLKYLQDYLK